jgi:hypothetical protein
MAANGFAMPEKKGGLQIFLDRRFKIRAPFKKGKFKNR